MRKFWNGLIVGVMLSAILFALPSLAAGIFQSIDVYVNNINIRVNNQAVTTDNFVYNNTTYIPLREVSELLGKDVLYDNSTKTVDINDKAISLPDGDDEVVLGVYTINDVELGMTTTELTNLHGQPDRIEPSALGFEWYVYNHDYSKYVQVGIKNNEVVAIFSNIGAWCLDNTVEIGSTKSEVNKHFGEPLTSVTENHTHYTLGSNEDEAIYDIDNNTYAYIFYDVHENITVTAALLWDKSLPFRDIFRGNFTNLDIEAWSSAMEKQLFDLSNTVRIRMGYSPYTWCNTATHSAKLHSADMAANNYFSHTNLDNESPFDRMAEQGITYTRAAENLACGQMSAMFAWNGLMNSSGHRANILGQCERLGVGVSYNASSNYHTYYTQNFYTPR